MRFQLVRSALRGLFLLALALTPVAWAAEPETSTPRSAVRAFHDAVLGGRLSEATDFLAATRPELDRRRLASELHRVLDSALLLRLANLSDDPDGRLNDGLAPQDELVGFVRGPGGREPVQLTRLSDGRWVFDVQTLEQVEGWYGRLPDRWLVERLPGVLLRAGPRGLYWWQWAAIPLLALVSFLLGKLLAGAVHFFLRRLASRMKSRFDGEMLEKIRAPLVLVCATFVARALVPQLALAAAARGWADAIIDALTLLAFYRAAVRTVDLWLEAMRASPLLGARPGSDAFLPLVSRTAKIGLGVVAGIVVFQKLGYPVTSLLAGLGIGGLALALAAQKTVENFFGSVVLGLDQPCKPGDYVRVDDLMGTVESVGLRSTRIRTLNRTLVTVPNGKLTDLRIESFTARDRMRLNCVLGLAYATRSEQVRGIVDELRMLVSTHPSCSVEQPPRVFFTGLTPHGLEIELNLWLETADFQEFQAMRQEILLSVLETVERHGASFAFPVRVLQMPKEVRLPEGKDAAA